MLSRYYNPLEVESPAPDSLDESKGTDDREVYPLEEPSKVESELLQRITAARTYRESPCPEGAFFGATIGKERVEGKSFDCEDLGEFEGAGSEKNAADWSGAPGL